MEWLMIIAFIAISILDSKKKSDKAKQQHTQRQQTGGQPVYRSGDARQAQQRPQTAKQSSQQEGSFMGSLTEFLESLEDALELDDKTDSKKPQQPVQKPAASKPTASKPAAQSKAKQAAQKTASAGKTLMQNAGKKKKAEPQTAKKSPAQLPTKTLMEQRPDREKREEHSKVAASVKPLKNAFENDEHCEHRIQLNPNIQYSKQQRTAAVAQSVVVKTDGDSIVQGIIWSEIMGKPKAYQNRARRMGR